MMVLRVYSKALIGLPLGVHNDDDDGNNETNDSVYDDIDNDDGVESLFKSINWTPTRRAQ